jgi:membrane protease YdiL (CAAX protease family)
MRDRGALWRGHVMSFGSEVLPAWGAAAGLRMLACVVLLELVIGPRFALGTWLDLPQPPLVARVALLLVLALILVRAVVRVPFAQIGLKPWRDWTAAERWYLAQVLLLANAVFALLYRSRLHDPARMLLGLAWGFHQELVYRGLLQGELVRRFHAIPGVLLANVLFTFGPLHFYHFSNGAASLPMFAAIFAIGLYFGILRHRSGNLWMPAIFHGVGNAWILGPAEG